MGHRVLRNNTTRADAVYIVRCTWTKGRYIVTGEWGKWDTFIKGGTLQSKVYYDGPNEASARNHCHELIAEKRGRAYFRESNYDTPFPWEIAQAEQIAAAAPAFAPFTPKPRSTPPPPPDPRQNTVAGLLEL